MFRPQSRQLRIVASLLTGIGVLLLVAGAAMGWLAPELDAQSILPAFLASAAAPVSSPHLAASGYLGADITALAVIIAVVIGFNATTLQIAGQIHSLSLVRAILISL